MKAKKKSKKKPIVVAVSGGFDPLHVGHVRYLKEAKKLGDRLVVILNNDNWLKAKKGYSFMPEHERKEVIEALTHVDEVILSKHTAGGTYTDPVWRSVTKELEIVKPHIFANGGDRKPDGDPVPEVALCESLGIKLVYNIGAGGKIQSSSWLTAKLAEQKKKGKRSDTKKRPRKLRARRKGLSLKDRQAFAR